ncbi:double-stranded RNA-binding protein 2-like [Primulina eburnea]|uniref:double-stranded RNA-binding protein 2-like n=1 Tax=Primulina eburnea TaxID=1245227 RepID=UPI003C6C5648
MYKNQLQELAQRSCFNLPSYTCIREGPDHAPRFKAIVNFNGDAFESPHYCSTLRQAEHSAAEAALISLCSTGPSHSLAARILDESGVYKNLLQKIAQRVGSPLPQYTTFRSGLGHLPIFTGTAELAGIIFTGEPAKNKKQAEKNAAFAAWMSLKQLAQQEGSSTYQEHENNDEQEQIRIARALQRYRLKENLKSTTTSMPFQKKYYTSTPRPSSPQSRTVSTSKILPLFSNKTAPQIRQPSPTKKNSHPPEVQTMHMPKLPAVGASPYVPFRQQCRPLYRGIAPPVTIRTSVPVFSAPAPVAARPAQVMQPRPMQIAPPVCIRQAVPVFAAPTSLKADSEETIDQNTCEADESTVVKCLEQLEM